MATIVRMPDLQDLAPIWLEVTLVNRFAKCHLVLEQGFWFSSSAKLSASPDTNESARGAYAAFDTWLDECRQPWIVRQVERFSFFVGALPIWMGLTSLLIWAASVDRHVEARREAWGLLKTGVKPGDEQHALELLLRLQVGNEPVAIPGWFWLTLASMLAVGLAVLSVPRIELAVGSLGRSRVIIAKWRTRFVWLTVPGVLAATLFRMAFALLSK
jgi:hypothetical protein